MSDRQLWLQEPCPTCAARHGLRCQTSRCRGKPTLYLHAARGWRHRSCPACKAQPGELCKTPTGRRASQPHTARLHVGRRELFAEPGVWEELEWWEAAAALVRFSGGGGSQGNIAAVTLQDAKGATLARWQSGEGELPEALAAPVWARYARFRGHPRISGVLMWDMRERQVVIAGERRGEKFEELLSASGQLDRPTGHARGRRRGRRVAPVRSRADGGTSPAGTGEASRSCARCGEPLPSGLRAEARYCSKRCRQAVSRARLKDRPASPPPGPAETCAWCAGPMPAGVRAEARFCSKRCRQASSRHALRARRSSPNTSGRRSTFRARGAMTQG